MLRGFYMFETRLNQRSAMALNIAASALRKEKFLKRKTRIELREATNRMLHRELAAIS